MTLRVQFGRLVVVGTNRISRRLRLGGGSMIGGRLGLVLDSGLLHELGRDRRIALVSGTNGKTTTTRLLAESLGGTTEVATSGAGANMPAGLVTALCQRTTGNTGVLEIDENYLPFAIKELTPHVVVLLNLSRDQLDRVSEVRMIATKWRHALADTTATVVANADDPLVVWAASLAPSVLWVGAGTQWHDDAFHCPACDQHIVFEPLSNSSKFESGSAPWSCQCGFSRPEPDAWLDDRHLHLGEGRAVPITLALPGRFNAANAVMAAVAASAFGVEVTTALDNMSAVENVAGRFSTLRVGTTDVRLLLAKNPAGWNELLELVRDENYPAVVAINAREADGNDPSWLWDVAFERLSKREILAAGERRLDLAVRLRHGGVTHSCVDDPIDAIIQRGNQKMDFIGNYTAFQDFRRDVERRSRRASPISRPLSSTTAHLDHVIESSTPVVNVGGGASTANDRRLAHVPRSIDLSVVVVHPDLLGTYGDGGNGRVLANRALWRGLTVELINASSDCPLPTSAHLYCLGGGEDGPQLRAAERLRDGSLASAVANGAVVFAVCAGFQIIGQSFAGIDDDLHEGVGLLDVTTVRGRGPRAVGEVQAIPLDDRLSAVTDSLTGFENHAGQTTRGPGVPGFATVVQGRGNGLDGTDGAMVANVVGTYLHGPVLARNPDLADLLITLATGLSLESLADEEEMALRADRIGSRSLSRRHRPEKRPRAVTQ